MSTESRTTLKGYFNENDVPTEANYASVIESFVHKTEDVGTYLPPAYGTAYALYPLAVASAGTSWEYSTSIKIDSFVNAQHDHSNTANGGALDFDGVNQHTHAGTASGGVISFGTGNAHDHAGSTSGGAISFGTANNHTHAGTATGGTLGVAATPYAVTYGTSGVTIMNTILMSLSDSTAANCIDVTVTQIENGAGFVESVDNLAKGSSSGIYFLDADGVAMTLTSTSHHIDMISGVWIKRNTTATQYFPYLQENGGGIYLALNTLGTAASPDLTTVVDNGVIDLFVSYVAHES